jgi:RecA-family ATPase
MQAQEAWKGGVMGKMDANERKRSGERPPSVEEMKDFLPNGKSSGSRQEPKSEPAAVGSAEQIKRAIEKAWHSFTTEELLKDPPPQEFIWKPRIPSGQVSILSGPGGSNKTTLITAVAVCRALGLTFLDGTVPKEGVTVILSTEDRLEDYRRKLASLRLEMGSNFKADLVAKRVHLVDLAGESIRMVKSEFGQYHPTVLPDALADVVHEKATRADLIVLETVSRLAGGAETNESLSILVESAQRLCKLTGAAVVLVHHVSQDAGRRGVAGQYVARGGSALGDNARSSMVLTRLTEENAKQYAPGSDLSDSGMERLLVFSHPKCNGAKAATALLLERWDNEHGPVLRLADLSTRRAESDAEKIENLRELADRLTAQGVIVTARILRDYIEELGVAKHAIGKLIIEARVAGAIRVEPRKGKGLGEQIIANPKPERRPDWAEGTA